jgi:hypothetical protein
MLIYNDVRHVNVPILDNKQLYIYVLENSPQKNIKIGVSTNMKQRLQSLSGSNTGGNKIVRCAISEATYLYTLERIIHQHFDEYRIDGTEWFQGISFDEAVTYIDSLFARDEYERCNRVRKASYERMCD